MSQDSTASASNRKSTRSTGRDTTAGKISRKSNGRPVKPYKDFPLFPHAVGQWAKKIRGKMHYFGVWADPDAALNRFLDQRDDLMAGRKPRADRDGLRVKDLANHFLTAKKRKLDAGELSLRSFGDYTSTCARIVNAFGGDRLVDDLDIDDFSQLRTALSTTRGPKGMETEIQRTRTVFKYGFDSGLIEKPMRYGQEFSKPSAKVIRQARQAKPKRIFSADEINTLLKAASVQMRAMILLGINCGWGNSDVANVPLAAFDLDRGTVDYPRPKTAIERRCTLWPETIEAIKAVLAKRKKPKDAADDTILLITKYGGRWTRATKPGVWVDSVGLEFAKLLKEKNLKREGVSFYALRHTFETIAGETRDQAAVDRIMGHESPSMAAQYREWLGDSREDERLRAVTGYVRAWLWPAKRTRIKKRPS